MKLHQFTEDGITAFRQFLNGCRNEPGTPPPLALLEDPAASQPLEPAVEIEPVHFDTKAHAAEYLTDRLSVFPDQRVDLNVGLWSWLSLFYLDSIAPSHSGQRTIKGEYYYILDAADSRYVYRHLLRIAWRVLKVSPEHNRLMLSTPASQLDKVSERVMSRLYLTRIPCFFEVLDRLYWDERNEKVKTGVANQKSPRPGDLTHRLPVRIRQLDLTYDLQSLSADQLIELLGDEFKPWITNAKPA